MGELPATGQSCPERQPSGSSSPSKGRFGPRHGRKERHRLGLPSTATIARDEFLKPPLTSGRSRRKAPPAWATRRPFPVELPRRLIDLYTYEEDVILDPFLGSGTTAVGDAHPASFHRV